MPVQLFTPEGLLPDAPYHHVAVGTGSRHLHVSGQVSRDEQLFEPDVLVELEATAILDDE